MQTYLSFSDLEGQPLFPLETKVTVGSEEGDVIVKHDSISLNVAHLP